MMWKIRKFSLQLGLELLTIRMIDEGFNYQLNLTLEILHTYQWKSPFT